MQQTLSSNQDNCSLAVTLSYADDHVDYSYSFQNNSQSTVFVFNLPAIEFSGRGSARVAQNDIVVEINPTRIVMGPKIVPVPSGMLVEVAITPCATLLLPNTSLVGQGSIGTPLEAKTPYANKNQLNDGKLASLPISFEVGYFVGLEDTEKHGRQLETNAGPAWYFSGFPCASQKLLSVGPFAGATPAIVPAK